MSIKVLRLALRINCDWSELNQVWALISLSKPNLLGKEYKEEIYQRKNPNDKKLNWYESTNQRDNKNNRTH